MTFQTYTEATAPESVQAALIQVKEKYGFLPNLLGTMAGAPSLLKGYLALNELFSQTSLNPVEQQVVLLTVSRENECSYCVSAHSKIAGMHKVPENIIKALRDNTLLPDSKLETLSKFTQAVVSSKGWPQKSELDAFLQAGYSTQQVLEVVLGVGLKTLSNYTNHIAHTDLDPAFADTAWTNGRKSAA